MKIHFCDLCNESVPDSDFAKGKAFLRHGRVVCATCESLMTTESEAQGRANHMTNVSVMTPMPATSSGQAPRPQSKESSPSWLGALALVATVAGAWYFYGELERERRLGEQAQVGLQQELTEVSYQLDQVSLRARQRENDLESRLRAGFDTRHSELAGGLASLRDELSAAREHQVTIDKEILELAKVQRDSDQENGRRLDDLLAQSMKARQTLDGLATRIDQAEVARAQQVAAAPLQVTPPSGPSYAAEMADLLSDTAGTRWNAVQSLGETGDPEVVPHLVPLLKDPDVFVRMAVARVCGDLASALAVEPLIDALEDEEPVVREAAMAALHIISGRDFRFDPNGKPAERAKRVKAWRDWWSKAKGDFFGDL